MVSDLGLALLYSPIELHDAYVSLPLYLITCWLDGLIVLTAFVFFRAFIQSGRHVGKHGYYAPVSILPTYLAKTSKRDGCLIRI
jgi:hypothetical protein